ncbi:uncharacterized protein LOC131170209 [Hevea brasiliensis]|uniref:uncharacterized protein LOC131170209 n=1 Tax=Hevea brasiliensis TaxID=3981 RepID=UPI0025E5299B|nr:uncharacterized protein LOC131170209 [Hevea brasiliensis]
MHQPLSVAASGLGASAGPSDTHQTISEVGEAQHSQRTVNHQDFLPINLATRTIRNSHPQLPAQLAIHLSFDCVPKTSSVIAIVQPTPPMQQPIPVSYFLESMQPFQWNDVTRSRTGLPFTSTYTLNGGDASLVEGVVLYSMRQDLDRFRHVFISKTIPSRQSCYPDLPMINYTVSHGLPKDSDLDEEIEDEMTEEIEELEELMIEYRRGLAGAFIEAHMKQQLYEANVVGSPLKDEKCCICQENYADGEDLWKLDCGHYFHFDSIKQWLIQKNNYPICKRKAL